MWPAFFNEAFNATYIEQRYFGVNPVTISNEGPLVFIADHPLGIIDGLALRDIAPRAHRDFRIMIHSLLRQDKDLLPYFFTRGLQSDQGSDEEHNLGEKGRSGMP